MARNSIRHPRDLTPRQREVLELAQARFTNAEIAAQLELSIGTVRSHLKAASRHAQLGKRRRSFRRAPGLPGRSLSRAEYNLLEALLQSPLVGELARLVSTSPRTCRSLVESILQKCSRSGGTRGVGPSKRRRAKAPGEDTPGSPTNPGSGQP